MTTDATAEQISVFPSRYSGTLHVNVCVTPALSGTLSEQPLSDVNLFEATSTEQVHDAIELAFNELAEEWLADTTYSSVVQSMITHPGYQRIVGMGARALPLILGRLKNQPEHWFPALQAITGQNPVTPSDAGDLRAMTNAWLEWGRRRHFI